MFIKSIKNDSLVELENPVEYLSGFIENSIKGFVTSDGDVDESSVSAIVYHCKINIIYAVLLLSVLPVMYILVLISFFKVLTPLQIVITNPIHIGLLAFCWCMSSATLPMVWWLYNNRLAYCIHMHMFAQTALSFYEHRFDDMDRALYFGHYLKCANREWDYNDKTNKL